MTSTYLSLVLSAIILMAVGVVLPALLLAGGAGALALRSEIRWMSQRMKPRPRSAVASAPMTAD